MIARVARAKPSPISLLQQGTRTLKITSLISELFQTWVLLFKEGHMLLVSLYDFFSFLESRENSLTTKLCITNDTLIIHKIALEFHL